jgi:hypothetical protein
MSRSVCRTRQDLHLPIVVEGVDSRGHDHIRKLRPQSVEYVLRSLPSQPLLVQLLGGRDCCLVRGERRPATAGL